MSHVNGTGAGGPAAGVAAEVQRLREVLEPLIQRFEALPPLLVQEREALRARDADGITAISGQIAQNLLAIRRIDQERQELTLILGGRLGLPRDDLNLESLDRALGGNSGLLEIRGRLQDRVARAEAENKENQAVYIGVMTATDSLLRALKDGAQGPASSYNRLGTRQGGARLHFLSRQL